MQIVDILLDNLGLMGMGASHTKSIVGVRSDVKGLGKADIYKAKKIPENFVGVKLLLKLITS